MKNNRKIFLFFPDGKDSNFLTKNQCKHATSTDYLHEEAPTLNSQLKHNSVDAAVGTSVDMAPAFYEKQCSFVLK